MKNVMNKLVMIAIVAALVLAGYMIINYAGSVNNVKIQANSGNNIPTIKENLKAAIK